MYVLSLLVRRRLWSLPVFIAMCFVLYMEICSSHFHLLFWPRPHHLVPISYLRHCHACDEDTNPIPVAWSNLILYIWGACQATLEYLNYFYEDRIGWFFVGIKKSVGFCIVVRRENERVGVILLALEISKPNWVATCRWLTRSFEAFHLFELHVGSVSFVVLRAGRLISLPLLHPLFGRMPCNF